MCKSALVVLLAIILIMALILVGCSSASSTSSPSVQTSSSPPPPVTTSTAPASSTSAPAGNINIGLISTMSGPFASTEPYWEPAVKMVVDNINASGGLLGQQVELIEKDDQGDPSVGAQKADELKDAGCVGILGSLTDTVNAALKTWAQTQKIPVMLTYAPQESYRTTDFNRYVFLSFPDSQAWAQSIAQYAIAQNIKSFYAIGTDFATTHELYNYFGSDVHKTNAGITDQGLGLTAPSDMDYTNYISTALVKKPDLFLAITGGPAFAAFVQQGLQLNLFNQVKTFLYGVLGPDSTGSFGKNFPQGLVGNDCLPFYLDTPQMKAFTQAYYARANVYPGDPTLPFYIGTLALLTAIKNANSTDPNAIIGACENLTLDTMVGTISYNDYDHQPNEPIWVATSSISPDYPVAVGVNLQEYTNIYLTKDQVLAARSGQ